MKRRELIVVTVMTLVLGTAAVVGSARAATGAADDAAKVRDWIAQLGSANANQRAAAACSLGELGEAADSAIPHIARLLGDESPVANFPCGDNDKYQHNSGNDLTVGKVAAVSLARINGPAVDTLISALADGNWVVRRNAALGLGVCGSDKAADPLATALGDATWQVRSQAAWALGLQGNESSVEPLCAALRDSNDEVRSQAAWSLGLKGDERAVEPLASALEDKSATVRSQAAWSLGLKGDEKSVEPLIRRLEDESTQVQMQAAWALGLKGDERALDPLTKALKSPSAEVRKQAAWALGLISLRDGRPGPRINPNPRPNVSTRKPQL